MTSPDKIQFVEELFISISEQSVGVKWHWMIALRSRVIVYLVETGFKGLTEFLSTFEPFYKKLISRFRWVKKMLWYHLIALLRSMSSCQSQICRRRDWKIKESHVHLFISAIFIDVWKVLLSLLATTGVKCIRMLIDCWNVVCQATHFLVQPSKSNNSLFYRF